MPNIDLKCADCGNDFYFTERDQEFYRTKGFSQPKRCFQCRQKRKEEKTGRQADPPTADFPQVWQEETNGNKRGRRGRGGN